MADQIGDSFVKNTTAQADDVFALEMGSDADFSSSALTNATKVSNNTTPDNPTFIQNQISIQRSPSTTAKHVSDLSRKLSTRSNSSHDAVAAPSISGVLDQSEERVGRGRGRGNSASSLIEATTKCSLTKSPSASTTGSGKSAKSNKSVRSVRSVHAVGSYPLGSLRVHSPSPTRPEIEARAFLRSGDVVLIREIPLGSVLGYDTRHLMIKENDNFEGIKAIPPGAHFIWGGSSTNSLRSGFWFMSAKKATDDLGEIHVKHWNKDKEMLDEEFVAAEAMFQKQAVGEVFDRLEEYAITITNPATPKKLEGYATASLAAQDKNIWNHLTSCIKGNMLTQITGHGWNKWHVLSSHDFRDTTKYPKPMPVDEKHAQKVYDEVLRFIFPKSLKLWRTSSLGRERTEQALDSSFHIHAVIHDNCPYEDSDAIVGELQFCYLTGMLLGNVACMEHWAHVIKRLFQAYKIALDEPAFFKKLIEAVHSQFIFDEAGLTGSILDHDPNLADDLKKILIVFKSRFNELLMALGSNITPEQEKVGEAFENLESWLWKWNWDLRGNYVRSGQIPLEDGEFVDAELTEFQDEDERGEYAPVFVEFDEDGRERGLIRF